jgi:hypothetical protein
LVASCKGILVAGEGASNEDIMLKEFGDLIELEK